MYLSQLYIHEYMHIVCCTNKMHKMPAMLLQVQGQGMLMVKRETWHPRLSLYIHIYQLSLQCITNTYIFLSCSFCPIIVYKNIIVNNHDCIIILTSIGTSHWWLLQTCYLIVIFVWRPDIIVSEVNEQILVQLFFTSRIELHVVGHLSLLLYFG